MPADSDDDPTENSPLIAAFAGSMDFIVPFVREFGSARYANRDGDTLLHAAVQGWQHHMAEFLLISDADPNARNKQGDTPLHSLTRSSKVPDGGTFISEPDPLSARAQTFTLLFLRRADRSIKNIQGATPLHLAAWGGDLHAIDQLVRPQAIDDVTSKGATALALAVFQGHASCAKRLIEFGANINFVFPSGLCISDHIQESDNPEMRALLCR